MKVKFLFTLSSILVASLLNLNATSLIEEAKNSGLKHFQKIKKK